jgi:predicted metal-dependent peptidase
MKKLALLLFSTGMISVVQAGNLPQDQLTQKATELTRTMTAELQLNELEFIKIKNLNAEKLAAVQETRATYQNDPEMKQKKTTELEQSYNQELMQILNKAQAEKYMNWQQNSNKPFTSFLSE